MNFAPRLSHISALLASSLLVGEIGMAEFNRVMTADDVMKMKNTLTAVADAVIVDGKGNVVEDGPVDYNAVGHRL